ncbi:hypothetical protein Bca52824_030583 [Brassica carinata]|uniref:Uncharacterized protein n=1 Tax=Brassica carinata TaxID=52824 RepID=A0A8X7S9H5_BRACI|nr:hypothetical protein Bca52824_030583 [Brassica carinata]
MVSDNSESDYKSDESSGNCKGNIDPTIYFKNLDLQYFVEEPLRMLYNHITLKNDCLSAGSPQAHYIEGILQYFQLHKYKKGLSHLRQSADGNYDNKAILKKEKNISISYNGKTINSYPTNVGT